MKENVKESFEGLLYESIVKQMYAKAVIVIVNK